MAALLNKILSDDPEVMLDGNAVNLTAEVQSVDLVTDRSITLLFALILPDEQFFRYTNGNYEVYINGIMSQEAVSGGSLMNAISDLNARLDAAGLQNMGIEYESYLHSSDIVFGRDYDYSISGNSGYRVFIYEYGLVGLFLVIAFYLIFMLKTSDKRIFWSVALISFLCFWVRGYPLWYSVFIPFYVLSCRTMPRGSVKQEEALLC